MDSYFSHAGSTFMHEYTQSRLNREILTGMSVYFSVFNTSSPKLKLALFSQIIFIHSKNNQGCSTQRPYWLSLASAPQMNSWKSRNTRVQTKSSFQLTFNKTHYDPAVVVTSAATTITTEVSGDLSCGPCNSVAANHVSRWSDTNTTHDSTSHNASCYGNYPRLSHAQLLDNTASFWCSPGFGMKSA